MPLTWETWKTGTARSRHLASQVAQMVESLTVVQETQVRSLGQEDAPEKQMATESSILALVGYNPCLR